jgi:hypothetical protein
VTGHVQLAGGVRHAGRGHLGPATARPLDVAPSQIGGNTSESLNISSYARQAMLTCIWQGGVLRVMPVGDSGLTGVSSCGVCRRTFKCGSAICALREPQCAIHQ